MATTSSEATIRAAVTAIIATCSMDKIIGHPNYTTWALLKQQCAKAASSVKTSKWGGNTGHLALVLNEVQFRSATNDVNATVDRQVCPPNVPAALQNNSNLLTRTRLAKENAQDKDEYWTQEAVDAAIVERITAELIDKVYVEELEDQYTGFSTSTIKTILAHIRTEWCVITTQEKATAAEKFRMPWDFVTHITKYARDLDKLQLICTDLGAEAADSTKVQTYILSMYACEVFEDREMQEWENRLEADKTWANAKTYFVPLWKMKSRHANAKESRRGGFESGNSLHEDTNSVNGRSSTSTSSYHTAGTGIAGPPSNVMTRDESTEMVEYCNSLEGSLVDSKETAMNLQTTNTQLMEKMEASNKEWMQKMTDQQEKFMKMMLTNKPADRDKRRDRGGNKRGTVCSNCNKKGIHKDADCFELESNAARRPPGWKSVF